MYAGGIERSELSLPLNLATKYPRYTINHGTDLRRFRYQKQKLF